jgi:Tfp pilus assembly protein PilZ
MSQRPTILVFASGQDEGDALARRVRDLGFRPAVAKTPDAARSIVEEPRFGVRAALLSTDLPVVDLGAALDDLRARANSGRLAFVAIGARPDAAGAERLREAGITLGVWEPYPEAALRFQLNRALDDGTSARDREAERVPIARRARIVSGRFAKAATIYTLSSGGAFVETPRPSPRGARVLLELVLPACDVVVEGRVIYTNVPGNLLRPNLPVGMGIRFHEPAPDAVQAIEECVRDASRCITVADDPPPREGWLERLRIRRH